MLTKRGLKIENQLTSNQDWSLIKRLSTHYKVVCIRGEKIIWEDEFHNLVVTDGLNDSLNKHLKGSSYTATWYVGLTGTTPVFNAADVMSSHSGWTEVTTYSNSTRVALHTLLGTASGGSITHSTPASFNINGTCTVGGAFICSVSTKGGTTGILYGGGAFSAGDRSLINEDVLNVTMTLTATG